MRHNAIPIPAIIAFILAVFGIGIPLIYYFASDAPKLDQQAMQTPAAETDVTPPKNQNTGSSQASLEIPGVEKKEDGHDFSDEMKLKLQAVSKAYEEQIKYPSFSVPIDPEELESKYLPDAPVASELPAQLSNPDSATLSLLPDKFRYFSGDNLLATARITGLDENKASSVSAQLKLRGEVVGYATVTALNDKPHAYQLDFNQLRFNDVEWKENLTIDAEFQFSGRSYSRSMSVEYLNTIAQVEEVAPSEVKGEYLTIPVYVSTNKPGHHRLQGNLYDVNSGKPLIHLKAEEELNSNSGTLTLKAHIAALKASGSEGPYELKDMMLKRLPSKPDYITEYGNVEREAFNIDGHAFSDYLDKPYVNKKAQRIARELRQLGS